jgi:hypothetical protein
MVDIKEKGRPSTSINPALRLVGFTNRSPRGGFEDAHDHTFSENFVTQLVDHSLKISCDLCNLCCGRGRLICLI